MSVREHRRLETSQHKAKWAPAYRPFACSAGTRRRFDMMSVRFRSQSVNRGGDSGAFGDSLSIRRCSLCAPKESVCSSDDGDSSSGTSLSEDGSGFASETSDDHVPRQPAGTHVVDSNDYFTFVDNRNFRDVKVLVRPRWCTEDALGTTQKSKTVTPSSFGDARESPTRAMLVLRSWMLWKFQARNFVNQRASRRNVFKDELARLRADIVKLSSDAAPSTGHQDADALIREWAPAAIASKA